MKFSGERVVPDAMHNNIDTYQSHLARYTWALEFCKNKKVIDAACGTGYGSSLLGNVAYGVSGLDISVETIDYAYEHYDSNKVSFVEENLDNPVLDLHDQGIDIIVTFETIEHLIGPIGFLGWCRDTAPEIIGSIPVSCLTEFHKHVWTEKQIGNLLGEIFPNIRYWYQDRLMIHHDRSKFDRVEQVLFRATR